MTAEEEAQVRELLAAYKNGKKMSELPPLESGADPTKMTAEVLYNGASRRAPLSVLAPYESAAKAAADNANAAAQNANAAAQNANAALESKVDYSKLLSDIWVGTAADYDAITTKQEDTMYLIDDTATAGTTTAGSGTMEKMWYGTRNDYERLTAKDDNVLYMLVEEF